MHVIGAWYLVTWFLANLGLTLMSKSMFRPSIFPFPLLLTSVHMLGTWIMCVIVRGIRLTDECRAWSWDQWRGCLWFSIVMTVNIWLSNFSLMSVSISVHQIFRTTVPLFTMFFSWLVFRQRYRLNVLPPVVLVVSGVIITVYSQRLSYSIFGLVIVLAGCVFASLKSIMTKNIQLDIDTLDLFKVICPTSMLLLLAASVVNGELRTFSNTYLPDESDALDAQVPTRLPLSTLALMLTVQAALASFLNFVSFKSSKYNSPLTMNIAGNVKQVVTPILYERGRIPATSFGGITIAFLGALGYIWICHRNMRVFARPAKTPVDLESAAPELGREVLELTDQSSHHRQLNEYPFSIACSNAEQTKDASPREELRLLA